MVRGRFVVFEGGEGCGKSTQAALLARRWGALLTRQPGGTAAGERLRELLLAPETGDLDPRTEALLMAADRAQHVAEVIGPALGVGTDVVCDRYVGSSIAYQAFGRGLDVEAVRRLSGWATGELWPDLVVLLTVAPDESRRRLGDSLAGFESAGDEFHGRVRQGFVAQAAADPHRWVAINGNGTIGEVQARVDAEVDRRWPVT